MLASAKGKYLKGTPYKVRKVIDLIRGERSDKALAILDNTNKGVVYCVRKVLKSAINNAQQKEKEIKLEDIYINRIFASDGARQKRFRARAMGRGAQILHRTTHLYVEVDRISKLQVPSSKPQAPSPKTKS
ncbi:MAG: 50S ribosomal protein L22 [Candidatus Omnitrophica bacterium]|nr:50S ribosomal protein L22 [Candidatus Omnitrophota bacterium]